MRTRYLIALLLLIPLVDALVLVFVVGWGLLTWLQTVALVVLTGLLGMLLVRAEGRHTIASFQRKLATGQLPTDELLDGGLLIGAGAFLLTPGLVTDLLGVVLALPVTRYPIRAALKRWVVVPYVDKQTDGFTTGRVWTAGFPDPERFGGEHSTSAEGDGDFVDVDFETAEGNFEKSDDEREGFDRDRSPDS